MSIIVIIIILLLFNYSNSYVNYNCFNELCNNGQYGYYYNDSITYIYIPYNIIDSLIIIGNNNHHNRIYNNITICLSISSYNIENDNTVRYVNSEYVEFDEYTSMKIKIVLLATQSNVVPKVEAIQVIGVSA
jgi:hypothetical protein